MVTIGDMVAGVLGMLEQYAEACEIRVRLSPMETYLLLLDRQLPNEAAQFVEESGLLEPDGSLSFQKELDKIRYM
jgi:hypothetical protein